VRGSLESGVLRGPAVETAGNTGQNLPAEVERPVGAGRLRYALPAVSTAGPRATSLKRDFPRLSLGMGREKAQSTVRDTRTS